MPVVFSRVTPEIAEALTRESERRGVKPAAVIREAIEAMFSPMINRAA
jgi:predicted DNA-binding protein